MNTQEALINSRFGNICLAVTILSFPTLVGFQHSVINPIAITLQVLFNETYVSRYNKPMPNSTWLTILTISASSIIITGFLGAMTVQTLLNFISPKRLMQVAHVINIVSVVIISLGAGLTGSYEAFIIGRFVSGFSGGVCYVLIPTFTAEMSSPSKRTFWQSFFGISIALGLFLGSVFGNPSILGSQSLYPFLFCLALLPSIMYLGGSTKFPETPFYLVRNRSTNEAKNVLRMLRQGSEEAIEEELQSIEKEVNTSNKLIGIRRILTTPQYRRQLVAVVVLLGNLMLCGANNIDIYSTLVVIEAGVNQTDAAYTTIGIFAGQLIATCIGTKFVQRFGGVRICMISNIIMFSSLILYTACKLAYYLAPSALPYISIFALTVYMMTWSGGSNTSTFVVIGEITIEPTRVTCMTYGNIVLWITSWLVGFLPPYLALGLGNYSMVPWIAFGVLGVFYMMFYFPEVKKEISEEIPPRTNSGISLTSLSPTTPLIK